MCHFTLTIVIKLIPMSAYSYISNADVNYIDSLYQHYKSDPNSIDKTWARFFEGFDFANTHGESNDSAPIMDDEVLEKEVAVRSLISMYRSRGHLLAKNNPLNLYKDHQPHLDLKDFNLSDRDLDKVFHAGKTIGLKTGSLKQILERLKKIYTGSIGYEFTAIREADILDWFIKKVEQDFFKFTLTNDEKRNILIRLNHAVSFEHFLHAKYIGQKRFSLEGLEVFIPAFDALINEGVKYGLEEVFIGMAHRGRLNVLANVMGKSYRYIFGEFEGKVEMNESLGAGDVKYHLGYTSDFKSSSGKTVLLNLASNPSHLETVTTVVMGNVRARLDNHHNKDYDKIIPVLIHGDAAVSGQGIVYEAVQMSRLNAYQVGGTIHLILNNQVGFTTDVDEARSSLYSTDLSSLVEAPELHVNADDPEAVIFAIKLAVEFRQLYHRDVFVDIIGYRKYGHNESDEPRFTQPKQYSIIDKHKNVRDIYFDKLLKEKVVDDTFLKDIKKVFMHKLDRILKEVRSGAELPYKRQRSDGSWKKMRRSKATDFDTSPITGITEGNYNQIANVLTTIPKGFNALRQIDRLFKNRKKMFFETELLDWGTAENLAYGSVLLDNKSIRISGQDVERGTFSHRHAKIVDKLTNKSYYPLSKLVGKENKFNIYNSLLSEYGVMGFEYGYSSADPHTLVIWEAQFGDFVNGAQIVIDQFIVSSETKWQRMSGLILMLPHGFEGQGPEHSSARPERFLQLCADYNMIVANVTTPANLFHLLRRQLAWTFRKPCIILTPKVLLRHPRCVSPKVDFLDNTKFQEIYPDKTIKMSDHVKKVLLCTGKIYYQLLEEKENAGHENVAIIRIEQLHPFPTKQLNHLLDAYKNLEKLIWVQEEPVNMGYWTYLKRTYFDQKIALQLVSRKPASSPSTGYIRKHKEEQEHIIKAAFNR